MSGSAACGQLTDCVFVAPRTGYAAVAAAVQDTREDGAVELPEDEAASLAAAMEEDEIVSMSLEEV